MIEKKTVELLFGKVSDRILENTNIFFDEFPDAQSQNYIFCSKTGNGHWVEGFWTGMELLCFEFSKDSRFLPPISAQIEKFRERIEKRIGVEHHDMGFLYSLSCVAKYKLDGDETAFRAALMAADCLCTRFREKGNFIQAWGRMDEPSEYRFIVDCLLNIPLLFWAYEQTKETKYFETAYKHLHTSLKYSIRDDFTTYHTFYFDPVTGAPVGGKTAQGYSDESCWARGQAWAIYGIALAYKYLKEPKLLEVFQQVTNCFINKLPKDDFIPYWDMIFDETSEEPKDTSAAVIAMCGILEMNRYFQNETYMDIFERMFESLINKYCALDDKTKNCLLTDAMYSRPQGHVPEAAIYGDYFFCEVLMRLINEKWEGYL